MLTHDPNFKRLKVGGRGNFTRASYWLGPDHLLVVRVEGFQEKYRRFSYRDIRAIVIRKTRLSLVTNIILGVVLAPLVAGVVFASDFAIRGTLGMIALLLFGALMMNLSKGASCACYIHTAVQTDRLPAVDRMKQARRLIEGLRPKVVPANEPV